jgi:predicted RNase H-like nuclease (RuvC/YqgF family)
MTPAPRKYPRPRKLLPLHRRPRAEIDADVRRLAALDQAHAELRAWIDRVRAARRKISRLAAELDRMHRSAHDTKHQLGSEMDTLDRRLRNL